MSFFTAVRSRRGSVVTAFASIAAALFAVPVLAATATQGDARTHSDTVIGIAAVTGTALALVLLAGAATLVVLGRRGRPAAPAPDHQPV